MVTTPIVATETYVNKIVVVGCSETDPFVCQSGCMKVYRSRNASHSVSKLKEKLFRIEVAKCAKAEANIFTIENRFKFALHLIFVPLYGLYVLIAEIEKEWIPKDLLNISDHCIDHLKRLKNEGLFGVTLSIALGDWFIYKN